MDAILQFLIDWGYWGLFLGSFIAGSVLPFSSEAVLAACVGPLGLDPVISITAATAGNVADGKDHLIFLQAANLDFHCACKLAQRLVSTAASRQHTAVMYRFFIKTPPKLWNIQSLDGCFAVYTFFARKTCSYLSLSIVQATVAYSNES